MARGPVRGPVRRPGRARRVQGRGPVHRLPDQVPHQAGGRLPPGRHRPQRVHAGRLAEALRYQPCSPRCANWLRYGIQPKNARPGLAPGRCKGKAHDADHLGYAGRRVLVSRKWSGKTLADHRADRKDWLLRTLGVSATDPAGTPGKRSRRATRTTWTTPGGCCTPWPTAHDGKPHLSKPGAEQLTWAACCLPGGLRDVYDSK